jgi:hypothetical protein
MKDDDFKAQLSELPPIEQVETLGIVVSCWLRKRLARRQSEIRTFVDYVALAYDRVIIIGEDIEVHGGKSSNWILLIGVLLSLVAAAAILSASSALGIHVLLGLILAGLVGGLALGAYLSVVEIKRVAA